MATYLHLTHCILSCTLRFHFLLRPIPPGFLPCSRRPQDAISQAVSPGATYQCFLPPNASQSPHPISPAPALALTPVFFFHSAAETPARSSSHRSSLAQLFASCLLCSGSVSRLPSRCVILKQSQASYPRCAPSRLQSPFLPNLTVLTVFSDSAKRGRSPLPTCTTFAFLLPLAARST